MAQHWNFERDENGRFVKGGNKNHPVFGGENTRFKVNHSDLVPKESRKVAAIKISNTLTGRKLSKSHIEKVKMNGLKGLMSQQNTKEPTSIEKKLYEELKLRGFLFETQKLINGKFIVDAYIPKLNLVIEVDGDYWHSLERVKKKDKAENAYLEKCGYNLMRLSENEINSGKFKRRLD